MNKNTLKENLISILRDNIYLSCSTCQTKESNEEDCKYCDEYVHDGWSLSYTQANEIIDFLLEEINKGD